MPKLEPETTIAASSDVFSKESNIDHARGLLAQYGYAQAIIPDPIADNILSDRIYFLVPAGDKFRSRTAFIHVLDDEEAVEIEVYRGWLAEHP